MGGGWGLPPGMREFVAGYQLEPLVWGYTTPTNPLGYFWIELKILLANVQIHLERRRDGVSSDVEDPPPKKTRQGKTFKAASTVNTVPSAVFEWNIEIEADRKFGRRDGRQNVSGQHSSLLYSFSALDASDFWSSGTPYIAFLSIGLFYFACLLDFLISSIVWLHHNRYIFANAWIYLCMRYKQQACFRRAHMRTTQVLI